MRLRWDAVPTATGYRLFRSSGNVGTAVVLDSADATSFEDCDAPAGETLTYRMRVNLPGEGWERSGPVTSFVLDPRPANDLSDANLSREPFASADAAILRPTGSGLRDIEVIRDGVVVDQNYDSFDGPNVALEDWYAIRFARAVRANEVQYVEGKSFDNGGWWLSLTVQYLDPQTLEWRDYPHVKLSPEYDFADRQEGRTAYTRWTFTFDPAIAAGIRVHGRPGGTTAFTSIAELEVYYR